MRDVPDDREQGRVDHGGPEPLEHGARDPRRIGRHQDREPDSAGLDEHAPGNQPFPANSVAERPRDDLERAPDTWVDGLDDPDRRDPEAVVAEEEWINTP